MSRDSCSRNKASSAAAATSLAIKTFWRTHYKVKLNSRVGIVLCCGVTHARTHGVFLFAKCRYLSILRFLLIYWLKGWVGGWGRHGVTPSWTMGPTLGSVPRPCSTECIRGDDRQTYRHTDTFAHFMMIMCCRNVTSIDKQPEHVSRAWAERKTERSGPKLGWGGAERSGERVSEKLGGAERSERSGAERERGDRGAGTERGAD